MGNSLKQKTISGMLWSFSDLMANQGISLIIQIILARLLSPKDFGIIGIVTVFIAVAQTIVDSGFTNAMIRDLKTSQEDYSTVFFFNLIVSVIMYLGLFFSANLISNFYNEPSLVMLIKVLSSVLVINVFGLIQRTMLTKNVDFKSQTIVNVISAIISGLVAIILAIKGFGIWSLVLYTIIKQIVQAMMYAAVNHWLPSLVFSIESFKRFYTFGWKLLVSSLLDTIYININNLVIGKLFTVDVLGYYTNASKLSNVVSQSLNGAISKVSYPVLSQLQDDENQLKNGYKKIILNLVFINFPLMIGLIAVARPLIILLLGEKWAQVIPYFQLLSITGVIYPLQAVNLDILQVKGRSDLFLRLTIIKKVIGVILISVVLILKQGIMGLLWIGVLNSCITYLINSHYSGVLLNYSTWKQIKDIIPILSAAFLMGLLVYGIGQLVTFGFLLEIFIQVFTGVISYILLCKIFRVKELKGIFNIMLELMGNK